MTEAKINDFVDKHPIISAIIVIIVGILMVGLLLLGISVVDNALKNKSKTEVIDASSNVLRVQ